MVTCPLFRCLVKSDPIEKPQSRYETKAIAKLAESVKTISETTAGTEGWPSFSTEMLNPNDSIPQLIIESEEYITEAGTKTPDVKTSPLEDTVGALKNRKDVRCSTFIRRPTKLIKNVTRYSSFKPIFGSVERTREGTVISDWGECFEDAEFRISAYEAASFQRVFDSIYSDCGTFLNSSFPRAESCLLVKTLSPKKMPVRSGMVWAMHLAKEVPRFKMLNLSTTLKQVVDTFLSFETGKSLPVSFTFSKVSRPKLLSAEKMDMALSEVLKGYLDESTQGLSFFVGPVNTKLCYKMSVCELNNLEQLFSMPVRQASTIMKKSSRKLRFADL